MATYRQIEELHAGVFPDGGPRRGGCGLCGDIGHLSLNCPNTVGGETKLGVKPKPSEIARLLREAACGMDLLEAAVSDISEKFAPACCSVSASVAPDPDAHTVRSVPSSPIGKDIEALICRVLAATRRLRDLEKAAAI